MSESTKQSEKIHTTGTLYPEIRVPKDRVFLMGDNRDNSADSRYSLVNQGLGGPVPWENIGGRAEFITFSFNGGESWNPLSWWGALRSGRAWDSLRPRIEKMGIERNSGVDACK